jgi:hypothetical protein
MPRLSHRSLAVHRTQAFGVEIEQQWSAIIVQFQHHEQQVKRNRFGAVWRVHAREFVCTGPD